MPEVSIRSYRDGDEHGILELFHRRFHPHRTQAHWRWKFRDHPLGQGLISVAVDDGGDIIAHCAGYPVLLVDAAAPPGQRPESGTSRQVTCQHIGDVMADPRAGRAGLSGSVFESTFRHLQKQVVSAGMPFMYGVVAAASDRFYARKLQRGVVGPVAYRRCDAARLRERIRRAGAGRVGLTVEVVDRPATDLDGLFRRVSASYGVLARRDASYIGWRYCRCPDREHRVYALRSGRRIVGWATFKRVESRLLWGDALIDPECPDAAAALLDAALREHEAAEIKAVEAWFPRHPEWWDRQLESLGFTMLAEPRGLRFVYVCAAAAEPVDESKLAGPLYYTMGDTDLF